MQRNNITVLYYTENLRKINNIYFRIYIDLFLAYSMPRDSIYINMIMLSIFVCCLSSLIVEIDLI